MQDFEPFDWIDLSANRRGLLAEFPEAQPARHIGPDGWRSDNRVPFTTSVKVAGVQSEVTFYCDRSGGLEELEIDFPVDPGDPWTAVGVTRRIAQLLEPIFGPPSSVVGECGEPLDLEGDVWFGATWRPQPGRILTVTAQNRKVPQQDEPWARSTMTLRRTTEPTKAA